VIREQPPKIINQKPEIKVKQHQLCLYPK